MLESAISSRIDLPVKAEYPMWFASARILLSFTAKVGVRCQRRGRKLSGRRSGECNNLNPGAGKKILLLKREFSMGIQVTDLHLLRDQLVIRRQKLETAVAKTQTANLLQLL